MFKRSQSIQQQDEAKAVEYISKVAPAALALDQDHIRFPQAVLLPITARASGLPGASERPWSRMSYSVFYGGTPTMYSISLRRELADAMKSSIRARRTLSEGLLMALATKTGRRPSMAETSQNQNMDQAESLLALGKPIFRATLLAALFSEPDNYDQAERARKLMETALRARGMAEGLSNKEIGQKLFISAGTVKAHSAAIYRKLDVANRTGAIARAKDLGLV